MVLPSLYNALSCLTSWLTFPKVCEKQTRDENGFKCHTQSESHVRQMLLIGEDPRKHISDFSNQFQRDFLQLLRTSHGEKKIHINHFYQQYIANKEHVHMNSTRWPSLTEFAKHVGREGLCRVEETDKGLHVSWIDNSPEALRRQDAIRKKERQDRGDEERERKVIREQVERAEMDAEAKGKEDEDEEEDEEKDEAARVLMRQAREKIKLNFGVKVKEGNQHTSLTVTKDEDTAGAKVLETEHAVSVSQAVVVPTPPPERVSLKTGMNNKPKNVFAGSSKKPAFGGAKAIAIQTPRKPMSEAERIMKEEIERKRGRDFNGMAGVGSKRQKVS